MKPIIVLFFAFFLLEEIFPQNIKDDWLISGQIQLRTELDGRDFSNLTHPLTFSSMRTRLGVAKSIEDKLEFFVQISDSRVFGEEQNTLKSISNIDLHQGYIKLKNLFDWDWIVQAGRFELKYGTERFIGPVGWHFVGRSFDGLKITIAPNNFNIDLFALTLQEANKYIGNANPSVYPLPQQASPSNSIYGFWKNNKFNDGSELDVFGYFDIDRTKNLQNQKKLSLFTVGSTFQGSYNNFSTIIEDAIQFGTNNGKDVFAYLVSAQGIYSFGNTKIGLGADFVSGTSPDEKNDLNSFNPAYGTNHKFYGFMDYFINVPLNSNNLGLNDFYLTGTFTPKESKFVFKAVLHQMMSNKSADILLASASAPTSENTFGQEADFSIRYNFIKGTAITWGGSFFIPGNLMKFNFNFRDDIAYWSYFMITANL